MNAPLLPVDLATVGNPRHHQFASGRIKGEDDSIVPNSKAILPGRPFIVSTSPCPNSAKELMPRATRSRLVGSSLRNSRAEPGEYWTV